MQPNLRAYPLPYLAIDLTASHFETGSEYSAKLIKWLEQSGEEVHKRRIRDAEQRVITNLVFAEAFDLLHQFDSKEAKDFKWDAWTDFTCSGNSIKIISTTISERWANTGPSAVLRLPRRVFDKSQAKVFIASAFCVPSVYFLGWFDREGLSASATEKVVQPMVSSSRIRPLWELDFLEKRRVKGFYT